MFFETKKTTDMEKNELLVGQKVDYKRNGIRGSFNAEILRISDKIKIRVYGYMDVPFDNRKTYIANVNPRSILRINNSIK
jgi:hypothetical protein